MKLLNLVLGIIALFLSTTVCAQKHDGKLFYDAVGREIMTTEGKKINYAETVVSSSDQKNPSTGVSLLKSLTDADTLGCPPTIEEVMMGSCIGSNAMESIDLDMDGINEYVFSAGYGYSGGAYWYVMKFFPAKSTYRIIWHSPVYQGVTITKIRKVTQAGQVTIAVGLSNGKMELYRGAYPLLVKTVTTGLTKVVDINSGDANNDGSNEIIVSDDNQLLILDETTFVQKQKLFMGGNFAIGNLDNDSKIEIAFAKGTAVEVTGNTVTPIWSFYSVNEYTKPLIEIADVDGDQIGEVVTAFPWDSLVVFDVDVKQRKYRINSDLDIDALTLNDIDADGISEIIYGDGQWGNIYVHAGGSGSLLWKVNNPEHGVTELMVDDADKDGVQEIIWASGCSSSGKDILFFADVDKKAIEWKSIDEGGPFYAIDIGDLNNDGKLEAVAISFDSNSGYDDGNVSIFNLETNELIYQSYRQGASTLFEDNAWTGIHDAKIADIDNDGISELLVATDDLYDGVVYSFNMVADTLVLKNKFNVDANDEITNIEIGDLDGDSRLEMVCSTNGKVMIFDAETMFKRWESTTPFSAIYDLKIGNVDGDASSEIVVSAGKIYVIDGISYAITSTLDVNFKGLALHSWVSSNGVKDIIVGNLTGGIKVFLGAEIHLSPVLNLSSGSNQPVYSVAIGKNANGANNIFYTSAGKLQRYTGGTPDVLLSGFGDKFGDRNALVTRYGAMLAGSTISAILIDSSCTQLTTGIGEQYGVVNLGNLIYPNPVNGELHIVVPNNESILKVELMDALGKKLNNFPGTKSAKQSVNLSGYANGFYYVTVQTDNGMTISKFLVQQ